jgi:hypothetical protein
VTRQVSERLKKVYTQPQLQVYGDLREITLSVHPQSPGVTETGGHPNRTH